MKSDATLSKRRRRFCEKPGACRAKGDGLCRHCHYIAVQKVAAKSIASKASSRNRKPPPVTLARHA